jgi:hypothetical protein
MRAASSAVLSRLREPVTLAVRSFSILFFARVAKLD